MKPARGSPRVNSAKSDSVRLAVDIRPGRASQAQKTAYRKFWTNLLTQVQDEVKSGEQ